MTFADYPLWFIFAASLVVVLAAAEIGRRLAGRGKSERGDNVATLEAAILGLLALMISFTFAMALSRFEARRDAILNEANAISTTALRAKLLPAPSSEAVLNLLRDYLKVRLDITRRVLTRQDLETAVTKSIKIQQALWQQAEELAAKNPAVVPTGLFIQSLNEMIDDQEKRVAAALNHLPDIVLVALYAVTTISIGFAGYAAGPNAQRSRLSVAIMSVLICVVILLIQDIDRPSSGFVLVSQRPMLDAAASLSSQAE